MFRKIWHDPVLSKVIASIVLAIFTYLISLITQNWILILGIGIAALTFYLIVFFIYKNSKGIVLNIENGIISASCTNDRINHIQNFIFSGKNKSNKRPILSVSGQLRSKLTNEIFPVYFNVNGNLVAPQRTNGIPAGARFEIIVPFVKDESNEFIKGENGRWDPNQGISLGTFLANLESSELKLDLDGQIYSYNISPAIIHKNIKSIQRMISPPIEPKITQNNIS
jgi:hypothetical protein